MSIIYGLLSHHFDKWWMIVGGTIFNSALTILFAFIHDITFVAIGYTLIIASMSIVGIVHGAWMQDTYPVANRGQYQGIRMIFFVLIPMVIGPPIGSTVIQNWGTPTIINGEAGYIPPPQIFIIGGLVALLSLIPILMIRPKRTIYKELSINNVDSPNEFH